MHKHRWTDTGRLHAAAAEDCKQNTDLQLILCFSFLGERGSDVTGGAIGKPVVCCRLREPRGGGRFSFQFWRCIGVLIVGNTTGLYCNFKCNLNYYDY